MGSRILTDPHTDPALFTLLRQFASSDFATQFHQTYYLQLMQEIFAVMTGRRGR